MQLWRDKNVLNLLNSFGKHQISKQLFSPDESVHAEAVHAEPDHEHQGVHNNDYDLNKKRSLASEYKFLASYEYFQRNNLDLGLNFKDIRILFLTEIKIRIYGMELGLKIDVRNPDPGFNRDKDPEADDEMIGIAEKIA